MGWRSWLGECGFWGNGEQAPHSGYLPHGARLGQAATGQTRKLGDGQRQDALVLGTQPYLGS